MTITTKLLKKNLLMASDGQVDGMFVGVYNLATDFGSQGATLAATSGYGRYCFIWGPDHPGQAGGAVVPIPDSGGSSRNGSYANGSDTLIGFTDDLGIPPKSWRPITTQRYRSDDDRPSQPSDALTTYYHFFGMHYDPDDSSGKVFHLIMEGFPVGATTDFPTNGNRIHEGTMLRSSDLLEWFGMGTIFDADNGNPIWLSSGVYFTGGNKVRRIDSTHWESIGRLGLSSDFANFPNGLATGKWTAPTSLGTWTNTTAYTVRFLPHPSTTPNTHFYDSTFSMVPWSFNVSGQDYMLMTEDSRPSGGVQHISLVPVDSNYNVLSSPPTIHLVDFPGGHFPSLDYHENFGAVYEQGILHIYAAMGYFSDTEAYPMGNHEAGLDYYACTIDASLANTAAPSGVTAECWMGTVVLQWLDVLPHRNYRIYRSTDGGSTFPFLADVTGLAYVDAPGGVNALYQYKVVTRFGGADQGSRTVKIYVSNASEIEANAHATRVLTTGGSNVDVAYVDQWFKLLRKIDRRERILAVADPRFGVIKDGSNVLSKVYCIGKPFYGDWHPKKGSTASLYNATGLGGVRPAVVGSTSSAHGYFGEGRFNLIRRKLQFSVGGVWQRTSTAAACLFSIGNDRTLQIRHSAGTPGTVVMQYFFQFQNINFASAASGSTTPQILISSYDGQFATAYLNGTAMGSPQAINPKDIDYGLDGRTSESGSLFVATGASLNLYNGNVGSSSIGSATPPQLDPGDTTHGYIFQNNEAGFNWSTIFFFDSGLTSKEAAMINDFLTADVAGASYSLTAFDAAFVKDIKVDYSAVGNGVANDAPPFNNWNAAARSYLATHNALCVLKVPAGTYLCVGQNATTGYNLPNFLLLGTDANSEVILRAEVDTGNGYWMGNSADSGSDQGMVESLFMVFAQFNAVSAGSRSIQLIPAHVSRRTRFTVGRPILLSQMEQEGDAGIPPNFLEFEWPIVTAIDSDGTIHLDRPIEFTYKTTWPHIFNESFPPALDSSPEPGGPATAYAVNAGWVGIHEYWNFTTYIPNAGQIKAPKQFIRFRNVRQDGTGSSYPTIFPTENEIHEWVDTSFVGITASEVDKIVGTFRILGGFYHDMAFQSASPRKLEVMRGAGFDNFRGLGVHNYFDGFYMTNQASTGNGMNWGAFSFGQTQSVIMINGCLNAQFDSGVVNGDVISGLGWTMSGGIINVPFSSVGVLPPFASKPGLPVYFESGHPINVFRTTDVTMTGTAGSRTFHIPTDRTGGFPPVIGPLSIRTHPAPIFAMKGVREQFPRNPDGSDKTRGQANGLYGECIGYSYGTPFKPLRSQGVISVTPDSIGINQPFHKFIGRLGRIDIDVRWAYDGSLTDLNALKWYFFGGPPAGIVVVKPDMTSAYWMPHVDLRFAGVRTITASGVTGLQGNDNIVLPAADFMFSDFSFQPFCPHDFSSDDGWQTSPGPINPLATIHVQLDQSAMTETGSAPTGWFRVL